MASVSMSVPFGPVAFLGHPTRAAKTTKANKATKASQAKEAKEAKGPNSDHRKEQNRIASKNYREKRKQKLALLRQILDEPAEGAASNTDTAIANTDADAQPAVTSSSLPAGTAPSHSMATFPPAAFPGFNNYNFQPNMLADLLSSGTDTQPAITASPPDPQAAAAAHPFSWMPAEPPLSAATAATASAAATLPTAELGSLGTPLLNPNAWTVPFASDLSASFPPLPVASSSATPLPSLPSLSSVTPASSSSPSDTIDNLDSLGHAFDLDPTLNLNLDLDLDLDLDQMMQSDLSAASFFAGMPMADTAFSFSASNPKSTSPAQVQATLPSRPSPRALWASLAQPGDIRNTYPAPATSASANSSTAANTAANTANSASPSRRTRKKNKPVVRAMLQYVQTLSSHQKRLILQALLDEGEGMPGQAADAAERVGEVEEVDDVDEPDDEDLDEYGNYDDNDSPISRNASSTTPDAGATAMQTLRRERRRQIASRWNASSRETALASAAAAYTNVSISSLGAEYQAFSAGFSSTSSAGRAKLPPTFMTMTLQCRRLTFCVAILQNSEACGLPNPAAMLEESCSLDGGGGGDNGSAVDDLQSPFALAADEARAVVVQGPVRIAAVVAAVRQQIERNGKTPPKDLQPVDAQILVAHHPYIDTIPFRGFRARALALLAQMEAEECIAEAAQQSANMLYSSTAGSASAAAAAPPYSQTSGAADTPCLLDEDELCYDMNVADGLICWGSQIGNDGMGMSSQAMRDSATSRDMRAGVPWDMRSWEPQVWFLKKYWYLVGGWDDDMWRNCRWWHSMRGEDLDYSVFAAPGY